MARAHPLAAGLGFLASVYAGLASANGTIAYEPHRGVGSAWTTATRYTLDTERLALDLHPAHYSARVTYAVKDSRATSPARATMYFPVACSRPDDGQREPVCVRRFQATLNGLVLTSRALRTADIARLAPLKQLVNRLDARLPTRRGDGETEYAQRTWSVYRVDIPADLQAESLTVSYDADYAQVAGGTSKSAIGDYSEAQLVYDFSPAAAWAGDAVRSLQIDVDARRLQSSWSFPAKAWPFASVSPGQWRMVVDKPRLAALPPLVLAIDNARYRQFASDAALLMRSKARYDVRMPGGPRPPGLHRDPAALTDGNPATFWCWQGPTARLQLRVDAAAIVQWLQSAADLAYFEGLGLVNGAPADMSTFGQHGMARSLDISTGSLHQHHTLPAVAMKSDEDRLRTWTLIEPGKWSAAFAHDRHFVTETDPSRVTPSDRRHIRRNTLQVTVKGTRTGPADENCIAEIYPIYNGG